MSKSATGSPPRTLPMSRRTTCRACSSANLTKFLSLGAFPLANAYLTKEQLSLPEDKFPLEVYFCADCSLVQLLDVVDPEVLFGNYLYRSGTNQTIVRHNAALAQAVIADRKLAGQDLVVEIASNDGSLLQAFRERGVRTLGVEPARNIAQIAREAGIETLNDFFDARVAQQIVASHGLAGAVLANNVLAHVDETVEFLRGCKRILRPDGRVVIEAPYLGEMLDKLEYDTIYHEHLCYFSVAALMRLAERAELALERVDRVEIHGGSLRIWAQHWDRAGHSEAVKKMAEEERAAGLTRIETYREFARRAAEQKDRLLSLLGRLQREGKSVAGYGAPAKGNTLLCYCGIGQDTLPWTADRSPLKVGLYTPGSHIPIVPFEAVGQRQSDYLLILAWNFAPEIIGSLESYRAKGGKFILPIPEPKVL